MGTRVPGNLIRTKYDFKWDVLDVIISGKSSIDSPAGFQIRNSDEATRFILSYGYDLDNPIEQAELLGNFHEALNFCRKYFLQPENPDGLKLEVPRKIVELSNIRDLFLMANFHFTGQNNDGPGLQLRGWACTLLKVMHTIAHIDKDVRSNYFSDIQQQIFDRFYRVIHRDGEGQLYFGEGDSDPQRVNLNAFETKPKKARDSIILKLLHKPENVAEDIFDRVGIRFVTETKLGALQVVKLLKEKMIVMPPNIKPSRSRNTLIDLDGFRSNLEVLFGRVERGELDEASFVGELDSAVQGPRVNPDNPHSSEFYRSIQFTCRQFVKLMNPVYNELKDLKAIAKSKGELLKEDELYKAIDKVDLKMVQREIRFFYPYEIQVVDKESNEDNERGRSAHSEYRRAQIQTALRRVMGSLADVAK